MDRVDPSVSRVKGLGKRASDDRLCCISFSGQKMSVLPADGGDGEDRDGPDSAAAAAAERGHGHFFCRKTFHRPTYCHHCTDMLWGLIGQGYVCEGGRISILFVHPGRYVDERRCSCDVM